MPTHSLGSAVVWSSVERILRQAIQLIIGIILARLLTPADYGLIGMLAIFFALANLFANGGLGLALIQRKNLTQNDKTSVFFINIIAGIILTGILCATAPLIASFYEQPILEAMVWVSSIQIFITSLGVVQSSLLTRRMDFKSQAIIGLICTILSGGIGILMALNGYGVWSLVIQGITACGINTILLWLLSPWRPIGRFEWDSLKNLWGFSSNSLTSGLLFVGFDNLYPLLIGKFYSPASLGLYIRANQLQQLPALMVTDIVGRVAFPHFSSMQHDKERLKAGLRRLSRVVATFHFPVMIGLAAIAEILIPFLLTDKWRDCITYFQILCFAGLLYPINALHISIINAQGGADIVLRLEIVKKTLLIAIIIVTYRFGVLAMVWGMLFQYIISSILNLFWSGRTLGYTPSEFMQDCLMIFICSCLCGVTAMGSGLLPITHILTKLTIQVLSGALIYSIIFFLLRHTVFRDAGQVIQGLIRRKLS